MQILEEGPGGGDRGPCGRGKRGEGEARVGDGGTRRGAQGGILFGNVSKGEETPCYGGRVSTQRMPRPERLMTPHNPPPPAVQPNPAKKALSYCGMGLIGGNLSHSLFAAPAVGR